MRVRYEAIDANHPALRTAENSLNKISNVLLQIDGCRATIVPCLHRADLPGNTHVLGIVLHTTMLNVEVLEMIHLMQSAVPVHLYIGEPLATATPFDTYSPDRLVLPDRLEPGDPLFCSGTQRAMVFGAYLHSTDDDNSLYGLTVGQAVVPHSGFALHPRLKPRGRHQRRVRSSQLAIQSLGRPLSNPAVKVVEQAIRVFELEKARIYAEVERTGAAVVSPLAQRRLQQQEGEVARLRESLARPHEYDVGHACAAEALIRPCSSESPSAERAACLSADEHPTDRKALTTDTPAERRSARRAWQKSSTRTCSRGRSSAWRPRRATTPSRCTRTRGRWSAGRRCRCTSATQMSSDRLGRTAMAS